MGYAGRAWLTLCLLLAGVPVAQAADLTEKMAPCLACHGAEGQSTTDNVPSLGGQRALYATIQLVMFREKMRVADPMNDMAKGLSDSDIQAIAAAIEKLPPPKPPADPIDPARYERARAVTEQNHCNVCHAADLSGQQTVPRLADQREDYLLKTLRGYKDGTRHAYEPIMLEVLQPIDDAQLVEFAYYLSHLH